MADRIIQTETLQLIANALRGGASQSASDKIDVTDFAEAAQYLKDVANSFVDFFNRNATRITIPEGVTSIGNNAFGNYTSLEEVVLPSTLTSIGSGAFASCSNLTRITIPEGVTSIGNSAFISCASLTEINLPSTLTSIGSGAFARCSNLTRITIPEGVTSIGSGAFDDINANAVINCGFSEGAVSGAPWGAPDTVTINYDVTN